MAVDEDGAVGPESTIAVTFDRSCTVLPNSDTLILATQSDVEQLAVCNSLGSTRVDIIGSSSDPITSLRPMRDITVSHISKLRVPL